MDTHREQHSTPCTFCELIHGSAEVSICHEDADAIAFMDIQPVNNGHVLVVPREHHESLLDVPEELGVHLFKVTMRIANAIRQVTGCEDLNIVVNSGAAAGQDEPHYHVHIIPRRVGDGFDIPLPFNGSEMPDRTVLDANAARIIAALRDPMRTQGGGSHGETTAAQQESVRAEASAAPNDRKASAWRGDRAIEMPMFSESPVSRRARDREKRDGVLQHVNEGAHGELLYQPTMDDAPA